MVDPPPLVLDVFAGSANTLVWIVRSLRGARGVLFEIDENVHALTRVNLSVISAPISYDCVDYADGLARLDVLQDQTVICFVAPPWGDAVDPRYGLNPPSVDQVIDEVSERLPTSPLLFVVRIYEKTTEASLVMVKPGSTLRNGACTPNCDRDQSRRSTRDEALPG